MDTTADVVIIGGGVIGASVAYHLAERGCTNVLILERGERQGMGSTGKATGGVRAQFTSAANVRMSLYSIDFFQHFLEATGYDSGYQPRGYLFLASNEQQLNELAANKERQVASGLAGVEIIDARAVSALVPILRTDDLVGAAFRQEDGFIDPLAVMTGFTARACELGVRLMLDTNVLGISVEAGKVSGVHTDRGPIRTRVVVNAAGAWAREVARSAGVELPVTPLRRQVLGARSLSRMPDRLPMVIDLATSFHFRPYPFDSTTDLLLVWPDPEEDVGFNTDFDDSFTAKVLRHARHRVPCFADLEINRETTRAGLYEMTPDHHAIIDRAPDLDGLYFVNGFSGHGVMHSPAAGRMAADMILDGECNLFDSARLSLSRFDGRPIVHEASLI